MSRSPLSAALARRPARGDILLTRMLLLIAILLAMLVVPIYLWKDKDNKAKERDAAERAIAAPQPASAAAAAAPAAESAAAVATAPTGDPDRFGLSYGWVPHDSLAHASCHGEPRDLDQPHRGSCNPYQGDTSCRKILPILCARASGAGGVALATAQPAAGFMIASREDADARCAQDLGAGWRMASFHDNGGQGWTLQGERLPGTALDTRLRAWVHIGDQRGNCWDPKP